MVSSDIVTGRDYMVSQSGSVTILCESLKMFTLPIMSSSFLFNDVERIAVPTTSPVHYFPSLRAAKRSLYGKKDLTLQVLFKIT